MPAKRKLSFARMTRRRPARRLLRSRRAWTNSPRTQYFTKHIIHACVVIHLCLYCVVSICLHRLAQVGRSQLPLPVLAGPCAAIGVLPLADGCVSPLRGAVRSGVPPLRGASRSAGQAGLPAGGQSSKRQRLGIPTTGDAELDEDYYHLFVQTCCVLALGFYDALAGGCSIILLLGMNRPGRCWPS